MPEPGPVDEASQFRSNTRNLVIDGTGQELDDIAVKLADHPIDVRRIEGSRNYADLLSLANGQSGFVVLIVHVDDPLGRGLKCLAHNMRPFLEPFDSVYGVYKLEIRSGEDIGREIIKHHGELAERYRDPESQP